MTEAGHSLEEQAAASAVASLIGSGWKRNRDNDSADAAGGWKPSKIARTATAAAFGPPVSAVAPKAVHSTSPSLQPSPFFYYRDHSEEPDADPLTPLTQPGRVPNFPAKMHAILSRPDLADVVAWMPHGRSWRVLKPREFEIRVIPTYFEHAKFSSFIRQANGWGFRRITQGRDRNSYYHPLFLGGLPHLCKKMRRPGVSEKTAADPDHEPDFYKISKMHPLPANANSEDESITLQCTVQGGPKARMPVLGSLGLCHGSNYCAISSSDNQNGMHNPEQDQGLLATRMPAAVLTSQKRLPAAVPSQPQAASLSISNPLHCLAAADHLTFAAMQAPQLAQNAAAQAAALQASTAASQFVAGFAAATALSSDHIRNVLGQVLAASSSHPLAAASSTASSPHLVHAVGSSSLNPHSGHQQPTNASKAW